MATKHQIKHWWFGLATADVFYHFSCTLSAGIDLENIVYYRDNTHYFVMTAKKQSLLDKGVIINVSKIAAQMLPANDAFFLYVKKSRLEY